VPAQLAASQEGLSSVSKLILLTSYPIADRTDVFPSIVLLYIQQEAEYK
jgi:hypothetical protein